MKKEKGTKKPKEILSKEMTEFSQFLGKYSIIALAIGTVLGQASKDVVHSLVTGVINPFIELFIPSGTIASYTYDFKGSKFLFGTFFEALLQMLVIAIIIFFTMKYVFKPLKLVPEDKKKSKKS